MQPSSANTKLPFVAQHNKKTQFSILSKFYLEHIKHHIAQTVQNDKSNGLYWTKMLKCNRLAYIAHRGIHNTHYYYLIFCFSAFWNEYFKNSFGHHLTFENISLFFLLFFAFLFVFTNTYYVLSLVEKTKTENFLWNIFLRF